MTAKRGFRAKLPKGIEIGERFLLHFDDPRVEASAYQGRLQDMSKSGLLCFDAPGDLRPPKGTPVTVRSLGATGACSFSSEIRGRGRLRGRLPVLLVELPERLDTQARRGAHRVNVCIRAEISWKSHPRCPTERGNAVITNLSGGGAMIFTRQRPHADFVSVRLQVPDAFIDEAARRSLPRPGPARRPSTHTASFHEACDRVRERFDGIRARVVHHRVHSRDARGAVYALSVAFSEAQEGCFQLVRHLERHALRKGLQAADPHRRAGGPRRPMATAA